MWIRHFIRMGDNTKVENILGSRPSENIRIGRLKKKTKNVARLNPTNLGRIGTQINKWQDIATSGGIFKEDEKAQTERTLKP